MESTYQFKAGEMYVQSGVIIMTPPPLSFCCIWVYICLGDPLLFVRKICFDDFPLSAGSRGTGDRRRLAGVHHWERSSLLPVYYQVDSALHGTPPLKHMAARLWKRFNGRMRP